MSMLCGILLFLIVLKAHQWKKYIEALWWYYWTNHELQMVEQQKKAYIEILLSVLERGVILVDKEWRVLRMNQIALTHQIQLGKKLSLDGKYFKSVTYPIADVGWIVFIEDQSKQMELDTAKNQLISNVSHELRTPLFHIKSLAETLEDYEHVLSKEEKIHSLKMIQSETDRLTRLVNHVLDLSKLENLSYNLDEVELTPLLNEARWKDIKIECEANLPRVKAHKDLLWQALCNLIENAVKFSDAKSQIVLRAYRMPNGRVRLEVSDEGIGIAHAHYEAIFERFWRVENQVHTLEGTGLGLSLVKSIMNTHQSEIWVSSVLNVGSSFWFDLYDSR
nr:two component sensor kinase [Cyanidioschyzonaceae sp. 3]